MSSINIFDAAGKKLEAISFSLASHATNVSPVLFSQAIRVLLQNWRQGTVGCKTRGELAFSNKKPWRQKGTGRARVSSIRSPLWRKGGIIFGPQPRVRKLDINRQQNRGVMASIFAEALSANRVVAVETSFTKPSTKQAHALLKSLNLQASKTLMFAPVDDFAVRASFSNLPNVVLISFDSPNAYICAHGQNWVFFKKDLELFKAMVEKWS